MAQGPTTGLQTAGTNFIGLNAAMKIISEPLTDNIIVDSELLDIFEHDMSIPTEETTGGQYIQLAHYFWLPGTVGARLETDYLPVATPPQFNNSFIYLKKNQAVIEMSGESYRRAKQGEGAFITWAERALPDIVRNLTNDIDRQLMGFGYGQVARVGDAAPATTVNLISPYGVAGMTQANLLFNEGRTIRYSPNPDASSPRAGVAQVLTVTSGGTFGAGQITIDTLPTSAAQNDYIYFGDANATGGHDGGTVDKEVEGLLGIVDNGTILTTFQGLARSSYSAWNAIYTDSSVSPFNQTLSDEVLMQADHDVYQLGNGRPDTVVTSRSGWRSYWKQMKGDRMFTFSPGNSADYKGGGRRLEVDLGDRTLELRVCRKCCPENAFLIEKASMKRWHNAGFFWDDTTGSIWNRVTDSTGRKDAYYATGVIVFQTGCLAPRHNARIINLLAS